MSVDGNLYSVPDTTRRHPVEVHSTADEVRILEQGTVIAVHPVVDGRGQRRITPGIAPPRRQSTAKRPAMAPRPAALAKLWHWARWPSTTPSVSAWLPTGRQHDQPRHAG